MIQGIYLNEREHRRRPTLAEDAAAPHRMLLRGMLGGGLQPVAAGRIFGMRFKEKRESSQH